MLSKRSWDCRKRWSLPPDIPCTSLDGRHMHIEPLLWATFIRDRHHEKFFFDSAYVKFLQDMAHYIVALGTIHHTGAIQLKSPEARWQMLSTTLFQAQDGSFFSSSIWNIQVTGYVILQSFAEETLSLILFWLVEAIQLPSNCSCRSLAALYSIFYRSFTGKYRFMARMTEHLEGLSSTFDRRGGQAKAGCPLGAVLRNQQPVGTSFATCVGKKSTHSCCQNLVDHTCCSGQESRPQRGTCILRTAETGPLTSSWLSLAQMLLHGTCVSALISLF